MKTKIITLIIAVIAVICVFAFIGGHSNNLKQMNIKQHEKVEIKLLYGNVPSEIALSVKYLDTDKEIVLDGMSADVFPNGDILYVGKDFSLRKLLVNGEEEIILGKEQASSQVFLNKNASMAVYTKPSDFEGGEMPFTNGIAVYDFQTNTEKVILENKGHTILHCGWLDDKIVIHDSAENRTYFSLLDLEGNKSELRTNSTLPKSRTMALRSLDGKYLAYESNIGDVVVVNLETGSDLRINDAKEPRWTKEGIRVSEELGYKVHKLK